MLDVLGSKLTEIAVQAVRQGILGGQASAERGIPDTRLVVSGRIALCGRPLLAEDRGVVAASWNTDACWTREVLEPLVVVAGKGMTGISRVVAGGRVLNPNAKSILCALRVIDIGCGGDNVAFDDTVVGPTQILAHGLSLACGRKCVETDEGASIATVNGIANSESRRATGLVDVADWGTAKSCRGVPAARPDKVAVVFIGEEGAVLLDACTGCGVEDTTLCIESNA
jgi:hypothetical protein